MRREKRRRGKEEDDNVRSTRYRRKETRTIGFSKCVLGDDVNDSWNFPTGFVLTSIKATTMTTTIQRSLVPVANGFSGTTSLYSPDVLSINKKYVCTRCISPLHVRLITQTDLIWHPTDYCYSLVEINIWRPPFIPPFISPFYRFGDDQIESWSMIFTLTWGSVFDVYIKSNIIKYLFPIYSQFSDSRFSSKSQFVYKCVSSWMLAKNHAQHIWELSQEMWREYRSLNMLPCSIFDRNK